MFSTRSVTDRAERVLREDSLTHHLISREDLAELVKFAKLGERVQRVESRVELTNESLYRAFNPGALVREAARRVVADVQRAVPVTIERSEDPLRLTHSLRARAYVLREADSITDAREYRFEDLGERDRPALPPPSEL